MSDTPQTFQRTLRTGIFSGPVAGLKYQTPSLAGITTEKGEFQYREGERIAFLVGNTSIGSAIGAPHINLADIVSRVDGNISKLLDAGLTNIARFVCSLDRDGDLNGGINIDPAVHDIIGKHRINFRHDISFAGLALNPALEFEQDPLIATLLAELSAAGLFTERTPRELCTAATARNEVRRNILGILRFKDVKIPLKNGLHVYADVFRPAKDGQFPVIMNCGPYGRAFYHHSIADDADFAAHEEMEERYFHGNPEGQVFENHETANTVDWVPHDYVLVRVDGPGSGKNPGTLAPFGIETAEAFRDAIDWAGVQSWCNGNVGLWGMSYYAMSQHAAASLQPRHLKAMIAIGTDVDLYDEVAYTGGILNEEFFTHWYKAGVLAAVCGEPNAVDFIGLLKATPFRDADTTTAFGPRSTILMSPDMSKVKVPLWTVACTTHMAHFHQLGSSEAYLATNTTAKKIDFWEDWFTKPYSRSAIADHRAFFDHWLKGIDNGIMDTPPVRLEIRSGNGASYLQEEQEWPIARTTYPRWYFDASPSDWQGDAYRTDFLRLLPTPPATDAQARYSAEIPLDLRMGIAPCFLPVKPPSVLEIWKTGIAFISEPLTEDMVFAGYGKARVWVSSSSADMDIYLSLRVLDENGQEVDYAGPTTMGMNVPNYPLAKGWLKASHRTIDTARSTHYTVKHTHRRADHAPLKSDEVVPVEIEIIPNTALLRKGYRLRVDIQPFDGVDHGPRHGYDAGYHDGAWNTVYTGPDRPGFIQLPIVPAKDV
ncbi:MULTISPECIES: CocE/NonD family hydrolase [unclassified Pseudomonas]|uniref:CocE/NonD family hydrolase n=1 Tax=unclassified Pseudomonas TaxID=196821 RepID=UPI000BA4485F|nr:MULTISPECIES: CocE/NonD family hydrolase [unclassified Pseudomonas]MCU1734255.1 CocE/NonD family hydrolase [Pseudomonas sp. 20P_3.2_Bac4]MCU1743098.1 CocE/NonD family hydrolase [Pseudomonas sp. 20P_3.2_Bac5]